MKLRSMQAVLDGNLVVVRLLLIHGADPNLADQDSWTPLHAAAANGHPAIVRFVKAKNRTFLLLVFNSINFFYLYSMEKWKTTINFP